MLAEVVLARAVLTWQPGCTTCQVRVQWRQGPRQVYTPTLGCCCTERRRTRTAHQAAAAPPQTLHRLAPAEEEAAQVETSGVAARFQEHLDRSRASLEEVQQHEAVLAPMLPPPQVG